MQDWNGMVPKFALRPSQVNLKCCLFVLVEVFFLSLQSWNLHPGRDRSLRHYRRDCDLKRKCSLARTATYIPIKFPLAFCASLHRILKKS